jgi:hypothetical protein
MDKYELLEKLRHLDEVTLLELLEVTSEDIVDRFLDRIIEKNDYIRKELQE